MIFHDRPYHFDRGKSRNFCPQGLNLRPDSDSSDVVFCPCVAHLSPLRLEIAGAVSSYVQLTRLLDFRRWLLWRVLPESARLNLS